jgi:oxygen-independent coproporphyrinogen-3 oxidase
MPRLKPKAKPAHLTPEASEIPAGIYVHIPFCQTKCPYCSFVSYAGMDSKLKTKYTQALKCQVQLLASHAWSRTRKFHSLFVGGGNPPCLDTEEMAIFIANCLDAFNFNAIRDKEAEITLEANPNSVNLEMLKRYREAGVNRLSIGIQAFSDTMLEKIGRKHTVKDGAEAFEFARAAGFSNINLDLMYGLPDQDIANWKNTLQQALALSPEHLSVYELTIEQGTPFAELARQEKLDLPHEEVTLSMFEHAQEVLSVNGYRQYEISNYAREGFECIHNVNYWENGSYIGLGGGAVSCFSGVRIKSVEDPVQFIQMIDADRMPFKEAEFLPLYARFRETVIMGLRMTAGVSIPRVEKQFGVTPQQFYGDTINELMSQELLEEVSSKLRLTPKGLLLANRVMERLV